MKQAKYIFAAALAMLALGCNKEQVTEAVPDGAEVGVTFTAELPGMQTKAIGDGLTAKNLTVEVYEDEAGAAGTNIVALHQTATFTALKADVKFSLVKGKTYHFIFWAQADNAPYTLDAAAKTVAISYAGEANDESRDAFYAVKTLKVLGPATEPVQLKRPFAQVNFGTADFDAAKAGGVEVTESSFTATDAATSLNLFAGEGVGSTDITYTEKELPAETLTLKDGTTYKYMAMNYFVPTGKFVESHVSNVKAHFVSASHTVEISSPSTPVQSNWRTNIVGNLLTDQVVFNVEIVPAFEDETTIDIENITTAADLRTALANGHSAKLAADITIDETISVPAGKDVVLDLNGHEINNAEDLWNEATGDWSLVSVRGGSLTIKGDGLLKAKENDCFAVDVQDGGHVIIEDGEYISNVHAVYVWVGTAEIRGGKYSVQQKFSDPTKADEFVLNCYDAHHRDGTAKIIVTGGEFVSFNPADCWAEGAHTNFLAPGYKTTEVLGTWYVSKATASPVVSAAGQSELDNILATGVSADVKLADGTYKLPATIADGVSISGQTGSEVIDGSVTAKITAKDFSVSDVIIKGSGKGVDGSSIALEGANSTVSNCNFENGRQATYGSDLSVSQAAGSVTTITGCDFRKSGFRGIMIWATGDEVKIDNCLFDNTYPFNCDAGTGKITVTDCELNGWTSYTNTVEVVTFTNCKFGKSTSGYAFLRPYCKTIITDCTFSSDFQINLNGSSTYTVELINCKYEDGTALGTAFIDADGFNPNATLIIDGQTYRF